MKICLFTHTCYPFTNGVATSIEQLTRILKMKNHEVTIVTNNYEGIHNDFTDKERIKIKSIPVFYQRLRVPLLLNRKLFKELDKNHFDIIHSHSDFGLAYLARRYAKKHNIPIIQTYHCNYLDYARENFGRLSYYFFYLPVKIYTKILCNTADRVIAPSYETKRLLEEKFKINKKVDYIPNGVDLEKFNSKSINQDIKRKYNIKDDEFIILSLSRISREKRIADIIQVLPYLNDCNNLKLLVVGNGPDEKRLKRIVKRLELNNIIFTGQVPFKEVQDYYNLGNVFITNSHAETQGLSVVEALSSSLPVICPNTSIYQELINNQDNGFLFNNREELIQIIENCYQNKERMHKMRIKAKESSQKFSLDKTVQEIEDLYKEEISKRK